MNDPSGKESFKHTRRGKQNGRKETIAEKVKTPEG
jgi:hypothetical protein